MSGKDFFRRKKYAVVSFDDGNVEVIPCCWIMNEKTAKWPVKKSLGFIARCIKECKEPDDDWENLKIKIYCLSRSFTRANEKATIAQETSDVGSDSSESEGCKRKKKLPMRYISSSDEEKEPSGSRTTKRQKKHETSIFPATSVSLPAPQHNKYNEEHAVMSNGEHGVMSNEEHGVMSNEEHGVMSNEEQGVMNNEDHGVMMSRLLKSIENVQQELKLLNKKVSELSVDIKEFKAQSGKDNMPINIFHNLPDNLEVPLTTDMALQDLNLELENNSSLQADLISYLTATSSGKSTNKLLTSILRNLITRDVAVLYSRLGRKGKKSFESLKGAYNVILACASKRYPELKREELGDAFGRVLAGATDWDGLRKSNIPGAS